MSISNDIKNLLDIQDTNITFEENCVMKGIFKGNSCKYVDGKLTYIPTRCVKCGIINEYDTVTKDGTQITRITLLITGVQPTYLRSKKQRFVCKACNKSFTAQTPIVKKNSFIYPYNNGRIEGINNKIKVLNRFSYGFRNFTNYKNRILLHFKFKPAHIKLETEQKETHTKVAQRSFTV